MTITEKMQALRNSENVVVSGNNTGLEVFKNIDAIVGYYDDLSPNTEEWHMVHDGNTGVSVFKDNTHRTYGYGGEYVKSFDTIEEAETFADYQNELSAIQEHLSVDDISDYISYLKEDEISDEEIIEMFEANNTIEELYN